MVWKTIAFTFLCPVLVAGCGGGERNEPRSAAPSAEPVLAVASAPFAVEAPDSLRFPVVWSGRSPLMVLSVSPGGEVLSTDTAALCADPFLEIETERLEMELEIAIARGDTAAAIAIAEALADSSGYTAVLFGLSGTARVFTAPGVELQPGDTVAVVTGAPPESLFVVSPGSGHLGWPEGVPGTRLPDGGLLMEGALSDDSIFLPGFYDVPPDLVREDGLSTFLLSARGDTIDVVVFRTGGHTRTVFSPIPLDSIPLARWN